MNDSGTISDSYFLSYSRTDQSFALRFATDLRESGVAMWVDQFDIRPSEHWDRAIERAVQACRGIIVILSPRSVVSDNVADEISYAIDSGKSVLPVMIERCTLPLRITRMQVVDATADYGRALQQCLNVLGSGETPRPAKEVSAAGPSGITDPDAISKAKEQLTHILGPIAPLVVDKAAARASSMEEFYDAIAQRIDDENDRKRFLALAGAARPSSGGRPKAAAPAARSSAPTAIPQGEVDRLASVLTHYLGPIAKVLAQRQSGSASSADDLRQRLASSIPNDADRAEFLRRVRAPAS